MVDSTAHRLARAETELAEATLDDQIALQTGDLRRRTVAHDPARNVAALETVGTRRCRAGAAADGEGRDAGAVNRPTGWRSTWYGRAERRGPPASENGARRRRKRSVHETQSMSMWPAPLAEGEAVPDLRFSAPPPVVSTLAISTSARRRDTGGLLRGASEQSPPRCAHERGESLRTLADDPVGDLRLASDAIMRHVGARAQSLDSHTPHGRSRSRRSIERRHGNTSGARLRAREAGRCSPRRPATRRALAVESR
jgi:hypothetical protein